MQAILAPREPESEHELDRLSQATRFVTHLQLQLAELDRREQELNEQSATLYEQQLLARRTAKSVQEQLAQSRKELDLRTGQLAESEETLRQRVLILQQQEQDYARRFQSLQLERDSLRQAQVENKRELAVEADEQHRKFRVAQEQWRAEQQQIQDRFLAEQVRLKNELETTKAAFLTERSQLQKALEAERSGAWEELEELRTGFAAEMERERNQLNSLKGGIQSEIAAERAAWHAERDTEREQINTQRAELTQQRAEQDRVNQQWSEHRKDERRQHLESLEEISRERLASLDLREREIQQREIDMQKRFRLHDDHLDRTRRELAAQRSEMEWQEQQQRIWVEQVEATVRMRLGQMRRFRELLTQRERCLADEQQVFAQQRTDSESQLSQQRENLSLERLRTAEIRESEQVNQHKLELRLQLEIDRLSEKQKTVSDLAEKLKSLLLELENSTHAAAEGQSTGHLSQIVTVLSRQLVELEESRKLLTEQQQIHRTETLELSAWVESREAWVKDREAIFSKQLEELSSREAAWQAERETWRNDRMQVEQLIRNLVLQLETTSAAA